ncbi:MAG: redoxin domain-containing protein [Pirellulales bacterium]|nr:redoxin domain-containing protein [Pirellulales bacterium]
MSVLVTKEAPSFTAQAVMPDGTFNNVSLSDYRGKHVLLFFYPLDFTFVCPTEIIAFSDAIAEFEALNVQLLGCSVDSHYSHFAWRNMARNVGGIGPIRYPLVADLDKSIAEAYDVLLPDGVALRGLFLIDREGVVRHQVVNDLPLGRSVEEALRMVKALQFFEENGEVCPANWHEGSATIKPDPEQSQQFFSKEYK